MQPNAQIRRSLPGKNITLAARNPALSHFLFQLPFLCYSSLERVPCWAGHCFQQAESVKSSRTPIQRIFSFLCCLWFCSISWGDKRSSKQNKNEDGNGATVSCHPSPRFSHRRIRWLSVKREQHLKLNGLGPESGCQLLLLHLNANSSHRDWYRFQLE